MNRATRTLLAALLLTSGWGGTPRAEPAGALAAIPSQPRNVVLVVADDHGQDTGAYGNPVIQTPNLDALAAEGIRFTDAFATTASCSASRSVILTGLQNHRTGQFGHQHDFHHFQSYDNLRSLPVLLSESGYRTAIVGTFHVAPREVYAFDEFLPGHSRSSVAMADSARDFVMADRDQPFFLYFATSDPHRGSGFAEDLPHAPDRFGNRLEGYPGIDPVVYDPDDVIVPPYLPDTPIARAELAQYYQSISRVDQGVGRLTALLKEAGVYDETLIIYISDHGIAFPGAKTTVYEPGLRVPLIVRHPDTDGGQVNEALVSLVDITPTILDFANVAPPTYSQHIDLPALREQLPAQQGLHGRSFLPVLGQSNPSGWDEVYASHTFHEIQMYYPMRAVRDRKFKLIWNVAYQLPYPFASDLWESPTWQDVYRQGPMAVFGARTVQDYIQRPEFELYDMEMDPHETHNLADDPQFADVLKAYQERLREFQRRTSDPWLLKWSYE